jgi:hypothetical protein
MNEPTTIYAGDKVEWTESLSAYLPSAGWTLKYVLINSAARETFESTADGDSHAVSLTSADTADWQPGSYTLQSYVEHTDGTIEVIRRLTVTVKQNLITATTYDFRTHAQKTLEAIESAIEGRASQSAMSLSITTRGGSSKALQYLSHKELIEARSYYKSLVESELAQEKISAGIDPGNKILISFK